MRNMQVTRRSFLGGATALAVGTAFGAAESGAYERADGRATDSVLVRRLYLDLAGRLPTIEEAKAFVDAENQRTGASVVPGGRDKLAELVDRLLASDDFVDYWSMRFADVLRVKSEFPINLWPNAVYVYHRRIRAFVRSGESWADFARALLMGKGSDFRDAEANFYRATAKRTPEGFAEIAAQTFLGENWRSVARLEELTPYFANIRVKHTREWKEEVVVIDGEDRRGEFADRLTGEWRDAFVAALTSRLRYWLLGEKVVGGSCLVTTNHSLKEFIRQIVLSDDYARGPVAGGFRCRRLDAEVLDDAICSLTGMKRDYQSIAPEPFTFLPPDRRTVAIEDGSITNGFLLLFGRPARDSGLLAERQNAITAKQRLYLFNSGKLFNALNCFSKNRPKKQTMSVLVDDLYWRFYSRPPTATEHAALMGHFRSLPTGKGKNGRARWAFPRDVAWALLNSREFLYQH